MKFEIGQSVKVIADGEEGEEGKVLSIHIDSQGTRYTISSVEIDLKAKKFIEGMKHCTEDELVAVTGEEKTSEA